MSETLFGEGNCFNSSEVRKRMYGMKTVIDAVEREGLSNLDGDALSQLEQKKIELQKEKQKFFDQRTAYNKLIRERSRQEELNEILEESIKNGTIIPLDYKRTNIEPSDNDLMVSLNDIHYGIEIDNYWNCYNPNVCREMFVEYLDRILKIRETHKSEDCYVWANGDLISGNIHYSIAIQNKENVIEQVKGVSELIAEFLAVLSEHFNNVYYVSVAGNHSRVAQDKNFALKDERMDDLIEWYLGARLSEFENVHIGECEKIDGTMYVINVRGNNYCGVHGDYDGTASKVQALQSMVGKPLYAILSGHLHHNAINEVQGVKTVMAGSFMGMDDYCVQKRILGKAEQLILVCNKDGIVCSYDVAL